MDPRTLDKRLILQRPGAGEDEIGQPMTVYTEVAKCWGNIAYQSGYEVIRGGAETSIVKASIAIRRRDDVTSAWRVICGSTTFEVKAVLPDEKDRSRMFLVCEVVS